MKKFKYLTCFLLAGFAATVSAQDVEPTAAPPAETLGEVAAETTDAQPLAPVSDAAVETTDAAVETADAAAETTDEQPLAPVSDATAETANAAVETADAADDQAAPQSDGQEDVAATVSTPAVTTEDQPASMPGNEPPVLEGEYLDGVVAIVNEGVVLRSELDRSLLAIQARAKDLDMQLPPPDILEEQALERLVVEEVQLQRADLVGINISDQMLNTAIAQMAEGAGFRFEDLPAKLAEDGMSYAEYRTEMRRQIKLDQLRRIEVIGRILVSQREVDQCLAAVDDDVIVNSEYNLAHVLVSVPDSATNAQFRLAEEEANDIYAKLQDGADFYAVAVRYSDSGTALDGGQLGWIKGGEMPTLFYDIVDGMQAGDVAEPVRNVSGYHIVKVNELRSADEHSEVEQYRIRHILITPNAVIDDATARQRLAEAVEDIQSGEEEFGELAKLMSDDPGSVNEGGEMDWTSADTFVDEFAATVVVSEVGVVSEPFQTQFGWHIVEVLDKRIYDNTADIRENTCATQVRNGKVASETELWMRRLRDEAFVDIRI